MKPRFVPDLQDPSDGFFNTAWAETYASLILFAAGEGDTRLADTTSETSLTSSYSSQDAAFTGGQNSPDYDVAAPVGKAAYETAEDCADAAVPEGSGSITPASFFSTAGAPLSAPTIFSSSVAGSLEVHIAEVSTVDGDAVMLAHADAQLFHASLNVTTPGHSAGLATVPISAALPASAAAPQANPAQGASGFITEAGVGSGGATSAQVQQALDESGLSVNGSGIKVGVLSDSFNDLGGAAADEANGALPSASNIDVIKDLASGGTDEGRAMMQIIHDIAPGASLAFYTAFDSEQDFANGILALAAAGSKVIVDDVSYFDEPFFQNGVVAQAIQTVEAEGVTYVTAAGNNGSNGYQAAWMPISGTFDGHALTDAESFGGSLVQSVTINTEGTGDDVPLLLEWNQAYGAATSDLEILVFQNGSLVGTATNRSSGESTNPWVDFDFTASGTYQVAIENLSGPNPGLIKEITVGDGLPATISGANSGTVFGHSMTPGAISAGAVNAADTPAFGLSPQSESFSSSGAGTALLFANNGTALSSPDVLSPVAVSGVDDVATTVSGGLSDFYGTSAASASLAGVAALIVSADPGVTPAQVEQIMEQTALPMSNPAESGAGLVQVDPAVAAAEALVSVIESFGSTSLVQVGNNYLLDSNSTGAGPKVIFGGAPLTAGEFAWTPIGAEQTSTGYEIALKDAANGQYTVWITDSSGNVSYDPSGNLSGSSAALEAYETSFHQDLNGDGVIGVSSTILESFGSTSLVQAGNNYFLDSNSRGAGPEVIFGGAPLTTGEFVWTPIGAEQTSTGYEIALKDAANGQYTVWITDSSGNVSYDPSGNLSGSSAALEAYETSFHQDLNGDGVIGVPSTILESFGSTSLVQAGNNYFLDSNSRGAGPEVIFGGAPLTTGEFVWTPIGAEQTSTGYEIALKDAANGQYTVWITDSSGNVSYDPSGNLSGSSAALEAYETSFHQDLNGDGVIGVPSTILESFGSTSLVQAGNNYFLDSNSRGAGPEVIFGGAPLTTGEFVWTPIGAEQTSTGYEIALKDAANGQYTVWITDSSGNVSYDPSGNLSGSSAALEAYETSFHQDLNGDGVIGVPSTIIESFGSTSLVQAGNNYFLDSNSRGAGPEVIFGGAPLTTGEFVWTPIGAEQTSTGYEIALKDAANGQYTVWITDSSGNVSYDPSGNLSGSSAALEAYETSFHQDLNGDGVIGVPVSAVATPATADTNSAPVTFSGSTLTLDTPSAFVGQIVGFAGDGTLQESDQINLRGTNYNSIHSVYDNSTGILAVSDGTNTTNIHLLGSYSQNNFKFADNGSGGTIVYAQSGASQLSTPGGAAAGNSVLTADQDTFVFAPNFGQITIANFAPETDTIQITKTVFANINALFAAMHDDSHGNPVITDAAHDTITIQNVTAAQLQAHQGDFHLV